ncbi:MAG: hypothetical protein OXG69_03295 [bacterium]|nr:hypothetical protein [bacterium]
MRSKAGVAEFGARANFGVRALWLRSFRAAPRRVAHRPAVVFVRDGEARPVIRRETYDDLLRLDL